MSSNFFKLHSLGGELVKDVQSLHIPYITFVDSEKVEKAEQYILKEAEDFFVNILRLPDIPELIDYQKTINWQDFQDPSKVPFEYFYDVIFFDFYERNIEGKLINQQKWAITFDEELTPIQVASIQPDLNATNQEGVKRDFFDRRKNRVRPHYRRHNPYPPYRKYGYISINGEPIFYYLHFTLQEILDALKL